LASQRQLKQEREIISTHRCSKTIFDDTLASKAHTWDFVSLVGGESMALTLMRIMIHPVLAAACNVLPKKGARFVSYTWQHVLTAKQRNACTMLS
jgi:hypothetical protein